MSNPNSSSSAATELGEAWKREMEAVWERIEAEYSPEVVQKVTVSVEVAVGRTAVSPAQELITVEINEAPENREE